MTGAKCENTARERNVSHLKKFPALDDIDQCGSMASFKQKYANPEKILAIMRYSGFATMQFCFTQKRLVTLTALAVLHPILSLGTQFSQEKKGKEKSLEPLPRRKWTPDKRIPSFFSERALAKKGKNPSKRERDYLFLLLCQIGAPFIPPFVHGRPGKGRRVIVAA